MRRHGPNKKGAGTCDVCHQRVGIGLGYWYLRDPGERELLGGPFGICCSSNQCAIEVGILGGSFRPPKLYDDGRLEMAYETYQQNKELVRSIASWDKTNKLWWVRKSEEERGRVLEVLDALGAEVPEAWREKPAWLVALEERAKSLGAYPFQMQGISWLAQRKYALLADDMGLGKTMQALLALGETRARVLVVCPASLKHNWANEVERWAPHLTPSVRKGLGSFSVPEPGEVVITNYELLPRPVKITVFERKKRKRWYYETGFDLSGCSVIVDEATMVKSTKAKRSKAVKILGQSADRVWLLSGTPLENTPIDLHGVLDAGHMFETVFRNFKNFRELFNAFYKQVAAQRWIWVFSTPKPEVPELLRRVMLRRKKTDVLKELPLRRYRDMAVDTPEELLEACGTAWDEWKQEERAKLPPLEKFSELRSKLASSRIDAMVEFVERYEEASEPLVVFCAHRAPIEVLSKRKGWVSILGGTSSTKRQEAVEAFQAGKALGIACTIKAAGYGLTLTRASHELFVDLSWEPMANAQSEDRCIRIGQEADSVLITRMVSDHPLDRHLLKLLTEKTRLIEKTIERRATPNPTAGKQAILPYGFRVESKAQQEQRKRLPDGLEPMKD